MSGYRPTDLLAKDGSGFIDLRCSCSLDCLILNYTVEIQGEGTSTPENRKMTRVGGSETLSYALYQDATRLITWGAGSRALNGVYSLLNFGTVQRTYVYGRIPAGQVRPAGTYKDSPSVVVTW